MSISHIHLVLSLLPSLSLFLSGRLPSKDGRRFAKKVLPLLPFLPPAAVSLYYHGQGFLPLSLAALRCSESVNCESIRLSAPTNLHYSTPTLLLPSSNFLHCFLLFLLPLLPLHILPGNTIFAMPESSSSSHSLSVHVSSFLAELPEEALEAVKFTAILPES